MTVTDTIIIWIINMIIIPSVKKIKRQAMKIEALEIVKSLLSAEAIRRAALQVVEEWERGIITDKPDYGCGGLSLACLRDTLNGYISEDLVNEVTGEEASHED
jgi:hypothetical protein